ncbi:MAG: hypothetical protein NUV50_06960 [Rhodospirillales bacterium]|nr:hypothetical protein [Rhodospirillales bacterium]
MKLSKLGDKAVHAMRRLLVALCGIMAAFAVSAQSAPPPDADALIRAFACRVLVGKGRVVLPVSVISDPKLTMLSLAERLAGGTQLNIIYNPKLMNRYRAVSRLFWLEHECAHHTLGHTLRTSAVSDAQMGQDEDAADCTAIQTLIKGLPGQAPMIDAAGRRVIEADLARLMPGGGYYKPGTVRARHIEACAQAVGG